MKRGLAGLVVALVLALPAAAAAAPSLRLVATTPLQLAGRGFAAHARVSLTLRSGELTRTATATASRSGTFSVNFGHLPLGRCTSFTVRALTPSGATAALRRLPAPSCLPAGTP